jgi:transcriptional regulator with XRE-family HTH domain
VPTLDKMTERTGLAEFLRTVRSRATPESLGLTTHGARRRVSGLRREELAQLAGLSVSYYTSLEQGRATHASAEVLQSIARALRLNDFEKTHLLDLGDAHRRSGRRRRRTFERPEPQLLALLDALADVPAFVHDPALDILAWNTLGHALYAPHLDRDSVASTSDRPNMARLVFRDPWCHDFYVDWKSKAEGLVGLLRHNAGKDPGNTALSDLVGELTVHSPDFSTLWARHVVRPCHVLTVPLRHPQVGDLTITQQALASVAAPQQVVVIATAEPGSDSEQKLRVLGALASSVPGMRQDSRSSTEA